MLSISLNYKSRTTESSSSCEFKDYY